MVSLGDPSFMNKFTFDDKQMTGKWKWGYLRKRRLIGRKKNENEDYVN